MFKYIRPCVWLVGCKPSVWFIKGIKMGRKTYFILILNYFLNKNIVLPIFGISKIQNLVCI